MPEAAQVSADAERIAQGINKLVVEMRADSLRDRLKDVTALQDYSYPRRRANLH